MELPLLADLPTWLVYLTGGVASLCTVAAVAWAFTTWSSRSLLCAGVSLWVTCLWLANAREVALAMLLSWVVFEAAAAVHTRRQAGRQVLSDEVLCGLNTWAGVLSKSAEWSAHGSSPVAFSEAVDRFDGYLRNHPEIEPRWHDELVRLQHGSLLEYVPKDRRRRSA